MNRRRGGITAFGALAILVVAGCMSDAPESTEMMTTTQSTGRVVGTVTDEEALPVAKVAVELQGIANATKVFTDAQGNFTFPSVEPGQYRLRAQKVGYQITTHSIQVVAGETLEVSLTLELVPVSITRHERFEVDGYMDVAVSAGGFSFPFNVTGTDQVTAARHPLDLDAVSAVAGMRWEPTITGTSEWMSISISYMETTMARDYGPSPILTRTDELGAKIQSAEFDLLTYWRLWTCGTDYQTCLDAPQTVAQIAFQQRSNVYVTVFYVEPAPTAYDPFPA